MPVSGPMNGRRPGRNNTLKHLKVADATMWCIPNKDPIKGSNPPTAQSFWDVFSLFGEHSLVAIHNLLTMYAVDDDSKRGWSKDKHFDCC